MCKHNEEDDYDCDDCCYQYGWDDFVDGEPCQPEYKNFSQCNSYVDGYTAAKLASTT